MYNLDKDQKTLKVLAADTYDNHILTNSDNAIVDHLSMLKIRKISVQLMNKLDI